jgi:hypothetical protein
MRRVVLADRHHVELAAFGPRQLVERRQLLDTGRAPARPEVHQRRLAREVREAGLVPVGIVEADGWSRFALMGAIHPLHLPLGRGRLGLVRGGLGRLLARGEREGRAENHEKAHRGRR